MAEDLITIGFRAKTSDLDKAAKKLDGMANSGKHTSKEFNSLESKIKSFSKNSSSAIASIDGPLGGIASRINAIASVATSGTLAMTAFALAITGAVAATVKGVAELDKLQVALAKSEALIRATGGAAGKTAESLASQAQEIAFATLASVEGIQKAQSVMLTFKAVSGSVFDESIMLAQDMATVFGGDASSAATQLGKALQDPIKGVSALTRVGVTFTDQQKEQIKTLIESGETIKAQTVILSELKNEFGGVAEAVAKETLSGSTDTIGQAFDNLTVQVATNVGALDTFKSIIDRMANGIRNTTELIKPDTASEAFDKAMNLMWDIADIEDRIEKTRDLQSKNRLKITRASLIAQRGEYLKYAKEVSETENKLSLERSDAILKSIELNKKAAEARRKAADLKNQKDAAKEYQKWIDTINNSTGKLEKVKDEIIEVYMAMDAGDIDTSTGIDYIKQLEDKVKSLDKAAKKTDTFGMMTGSIKEALGAVQGLSAQGSKEFKKLGVAMQAVTVIQKGLAIASAATMATITGGISAVAALVGMIGGLGGTIETTFETNQQLQGLNIWGDKSESIANSIDLTASATDKLVGINTGMLKALQSMQAGISSAAGISARGVSGATFDTSASKVKTNALSGLTGLVSSNFIDKMSFGLFSGVFKSIGKLLGGKSKVTDEGIKVVGGALGDLINNVSVQAFQEVKSKKYRWSHTKTKEYYSDLEGASKQFGLVFDSLADSVYQGGISLGLNSSMLEKKINEFNVATTKISLKGLSVEDQQKEIEAVFGQIFDDLANSVIPFAKDFQQTGEGIGETLARLSAEVATADFAVKNLGISLGNKLANPELYTRISDNLTKLTGGIESFADKVSSFVDDFAPDSVKFKMYSDSITKQLESVGLSVPATSKGFFELMQTLDGTTEAGQKQIAALLNSQDAAKEYYNLLEKSENERVSSIVKFSNSLKSLSSNLSSAIKGIYGTSEAANELALNTAIQAARAGDFTKALGLNLSGFTFDQSDFATNLDFQEAQAESANKLDELAKLADGQSSIEGMKLQTAQDQLSVLNEINGTLKGSYIPQTNTTENYDTMIAELKAMRKEMEATRAATQATAKHSANSADSLNVINRNGIDTRAIQ